MDENKWFYVLTSENKAVINTRTLSPQKFIEKDLWWKGQAFLSHSDNHFLSHSSSLPSRDIEEKQVASMLVVTKETVGIGSVIDGMVVLTNLCR